MAYGAALMLAYGLASGKPLIVDASPAYLLSMAYLAVFGSVLAFGCYLTLLGRIGPERAAYATLLFPVVALGISTAFEDYQWTAYGLTGMGLVLAGNFLVLSQPGLIRRFSRRLGVKRFPGKPIPSPACERGT
jgi:drug/metabolite transporter (DMT)-like permease